MNHRTTARICAPVCERGVEQTLNAVKQAEQIVDLVEMRLDCLQLSQVDEARSLVQKILEQTTVPLIVTLRPEEQGGKQKLSGAERQEFWSNFRCEGNVLFDLELDLVPNLPGINLDQVICSHHDFKGVPDDLHRIYQRMTDTTARILKIAVQADDVVDCLPVFALLERARNEGRDLIAIAMGEFGTATRVLGPAYGSFLTYAPVSATNATAPGQLSAADLKELYRVDQISRETSITGLIGLPVGHSFSPYLHNAAFASSNFDGIYLPLAVRDLDQFMQRMVSPATRELDWNLKGLSVTAPHKSAVMKWLDRIEPVAEQIGAVNTILVEASELHGYNTDAGAFIEPLRARRRELNDLKCAVIGAGGAARTVIWSLQNEGAHATLFARDRSRAEVLASDFAIELRDLANASFASFDVVVNATPLGTAGPLASQSVATAQQLRGAGLAYDLVYNPQETPFLKAANIAGCETVGGLEMLVNQAKSQFKLWTKQEPPRLVMEEAAVRAIERGK